VRTLKTFQGTHILGASRGLLCDSYAVLLADRTTQYDRLLASSCRPSVCDSVHCCSQRWCTGLKVVLACF